MCGIADEDMQRQLSAKPKLTYEKAVELVLSMEMVGCNVMELKPIRNLEGNSQTYEVQPVASLTKTVMTCDC